MLNVILKALKILLPRRILDPLHSFNIAFNESVSKVIADCTVIIKAAILESTPVRSTETLIDWYGELGLPYDSTESLAVRRARAHRAFTALGAQNPTYLREQLQLEYPDVDFNERTGSGAEEGLFYEFTGSIDPTPDDFDYQRFLTLVSKIFPLHLEFTDLTELSDDVTSDICFAGRAGAARCGRDIGDP